MFATAWLCWVRPIAQQAIDAVACRREVGELARSSGAGIPSPRRFPRSRAASAAANVIEARRCGAAMNSLIHAWPRRRASSCRACLIDALEAGPRRRRPARSTVSAIGVPPPTASSGCCGCVNSRQPTSGSGLIATILAPRCAAAAASSACADGSCRGSGRPQDASARSKSSSVHGALAHPDASRQRDAARFVAHVRTVGEIVRAERAHEQLVEERRLVAGAAGGVEHRAVGARRARASSRRRARTRVPGDRPRSASARRAAHRLGQRPCCPSP